MAKTHKNSDVINWGTIKHNLLKRDLENDMGRYRERVVKDKTQYRKPKYRNRLFEID